MAAIRVGVVAIVIQPGGMVVIRIGVAAETRAEATISRTAGVGVMIAVAAIQPGAMVAMVAILNGATGVAAIRATVTSP